ncbi:hypothetical protein PoB_002358600 [Plakobranchus ocellatus]|uniref:Uncharacterized protein n=1 Tax=Plakobranchus ocellatus TaxID=259542 RepID=A0AAV3ZM90_9GAST|nr:hypothetical protein PoB_002358600 [Plakobranchus ocellatus]
MAANGGKIRKRSSCLASLDLDNFNIQDYLCRNSFVVLNLLRYYPDPRSRSYFGLDNCLHWDVFDILLTDGKGKRKFVTSADVVIKHKICSGSYVRVKRAERYWEDTENDRVAVVVIHDLEVLLKEQVHVSDKLMSLPWVPRNFSKQELTQPLASNRIYYMDNWTFSLASDQHFEDVKHVALENIDLSEVRTVKSVVLKKSSSVKSSYLLVKVMRKSRLIHYITRFKEATWPFQLPLMVADSSGWCPAVLWNRLGVQFHKHIQEGSVLLVKNFRVKAGLQQKTKSYFNPPETAAVFSQELSLDIHHPKTELFVVDYTENDNIDELRLPPLEVRLMPRRDLIPQQSDLRLLGPPSGQGAGGWARTRDRRVPADFRADSLATVLPTPL